MIHLIPIKNQASPYWDSLVLVYHTSFPIEEQRPLESIIHLLDNEQRYELYALTDEEERFVGMFSTWNFTSFIYVEHFALTPALRSRGYGSEALKTFIHKHKRPLVLEVEPPSDELTLRRIQFYERCGLMLYDHPYMQPAYTPEGNPIALRLMGTLDTTVTSLTQVSHILHREVYNRED